MKKLLILLLLAGCAKKQSTPTPSTPQSQTTYTPPSSNTNAPALLMDSTWIPVLVGYSSIRLGSDGSYRENGSLQGTWRMRAPDSVRITTAFYLIDWRLVSVTADTLKLKNVGSFILTYHH